MIYTEGIEAEELERKRVLRQALSARTLSQVLAATQELKQWVAAHPDDLGIIDAFEQLSLMEDIAREKEASNSDSESGSRSNLQAEIVTT